MLKTLISEFLRLGFLRAGGMSSPPGQNCPDQEEQLQWRRDPLSHPALQAMTPAQLGDLPFDGRRIHTGPSAGRC